MKRISQTWLIALSAAAGLLAHEVFCRLVKPHLKDPALYRSATGVLVALPFVEAHAAHGVPAVGSAFLSFAGVGVGAAVGTLLDQALERWTVKRHAGVAQW